MRSENEQDKLIKEVEDAVAITFPWVALAALIALLVVALTGCATTVVPRPVAASEASWDSNAQTSGVLLSTATGFVVTDLFRERYNNLIAIYGRSSDHALKPDFDLIPAGKGQWLISKHGMEHHLEMSALSDAGLKPKNL